MRRLVRSRLFQFGAVVTVVMAGRLLPEAGPREQRRLPASNAFLAKAPAMDGEGPVVSAVRIVRAYTRFPAAGPDASAAIIRTLATRADGDRIAAAVREDLRRLAAGYPGGVTAIWVGPLGARVEPRPGGRVQVNVWFSRVVEPPHLPIYQEWRVAEMELAEEAGVWRLADYRDVDGPRPQAHPVGQGPPAEPASIDGFLGVDG